MESNTVKFQMKRIEVMELIDALRIIAYLGDISGHDLDQVGRIDWFVGELVQTTERTNTPTLQVEFSEDMWGMIMSVNGDLTLLSGYEEDEDPAELAAIDAVNEFLIAAGRKIGCSIFQSPEDKKAIEEAFGENLDHLE